METRKIIDGKLLEIDRELHNIQIKLERREFILLKDTDGVFLEVEPHVQKPLKSGSGSESGKGEPETSSQSRR